MTDSPNTAQNAPRRPWLRRTVLGVMVAGLAAGAGWQAFAAGDHGGRHHRSFMSGSMDPAAMDARLDRMLKHLYVEIEATEAQKAKLGPIVKAAAKDLAPMREKVRAARKQATDLLTRDTIDRGAIESLRAEQVGLAGEATRRFTQALTDVAEILTPAQRKQLAERMESRRHRWHRG